MALHKFYSYLILTRRFGPICVYVKATDCNLHVTN